MVSETLSPLAAELLSAEENPRTDPPRVQGLALLPPVLVESQIHKSLVGKD